MIDDERLRRRGLLAGVAGSASLIAGCARGSFDGSRSGRVYDPTGMAAIRPIDEPYVRQGLTADAGQYLFGRLFRPGDSLAVTDAAGASGFAEAVDDLAEEQFAIVTMLRTAAAAPAYLWPVDTHWDEGTRRDAGTLEIGLEREAKAASERGDEVVGVAVTVFDYEGTLPDPIELVLPSGARLPMGAAR